MSAREIVLVRALSRGGGAARQEDETDGHWFC